MKPFIATLLLAFAGIAPVQAQLLMPGQAASQGEQRLDRIVAVVNQDVILQSELDEAVASIQQRYAGQAGQLPPLDVLQKQVLNRLVLMRLQVQKAAERGIQVSQQDIDQAVAGVAQQNGMTADQLRVNVERSGLSFADFRNQLADQITVQRLHQSVVREQVSITDSEIDNLLKSPSYKTGEVHLQHIQVNIPGGADAAAIQAAYAKAEQALAAIQGGMDFGAAAIRYSDAANALEGGDLGWRKMNEIPPAFVDTITSLKDGQVSPILRGPTGFHILKVVAQRQASPTMVTEFHARQILISPSELVTPEQARQKAEDLYHRIVDKHEDFAKLAKEYSKDDTTANIGGDMGWFPQAAWGANIAHELGVLKDNEVSQPFQSQAGWHILQRLGERQSDQTEEAERAQAREAIGNRKAEQVYDNFLRDLRSNAYVDILVPALQDADAPSASAS